LNGSVEAVVGAGRAIAITAVGPLGHHPAIQLVAYAMQRNKSLAKSPVPSPSHWEPCRPSLQACTASNSVTGTFDKRSGHLRPCAAPESPAREILWKGSKRTVRFVPETSRIPPSNDTRSQPHVSVERRRRDPQRHIDIDITDLQRLVGIELLRDRHLRSTRRHLGATSASPARWRGSQPGPSSRSSL